MLDQEGIAMHVASLHCFSSIFLIKKKQRKTALQRAFWLFFCFVCLRTWKKQHSTPQLEQLSALHQLSSFRKHFHIVKVVYFS